MEFSMQKSDYIKYKKAMDYWEYIRDLRNGQEKDIDIELRLLRFIIKSIHGKVLLRVKSKKENFNYIFETIWFSYNEKENNILLTIDSEEKHLQLELCNGKVKKISPGCYLIEDKCHDYEISNKELCKGEKEKFFKENYLNIKAQENIFLDYVNLDEIFKNIHSTPDLDANWENFSQEIKNVYYDENYQLFFKFIQGKGINCFIDLFKVIQIQFGENAFRFLLVKQDKSHEYKKIILKKTDIISWQIIYNKPTFSIGVSTSIWGNNIKKSSELYIEKQMKIERT